MPSDFLKFPNKIYPFEGSCLDLDGVGLHYLDEGRGDPVVMIHGNPSWSIYYRELVKSLNDCFRTIVPDHIGCGLSDKPDDTVYEYTLVNRVNDLERLMAHLGVDDNITLILHDWGGMIGMAYAARHPQSIRRIVIFNTSAFHKPEAKSFPWLLWLCRNFFPGQFMVRRFNAFSRIAARICCKRQPMSRELREAYCAPYSENSIATLRFVQDIPLRPGDRAYDTVTEVQDALPMFRHLPVLICWGDKDFVFDRHFLDEWIRIFPGAEVHRFPDCGHYILEDATEEIIKIVSDFFKKHPVSKVRG